MKNLRWYVLLLVFVAPSIVAIAQASVLHFPSADPFMGTPYHLYPQVLFDPIRFGLVLAAIIFVAGYTLLSRRFGRLLSKVRAILIVFSAAINIAAFWLGINLA